MLQLRRWLNNSSPGITKQPQKKQNFVIVPSVGETRAAKLCTNCFTLGAIIEGRLMHGDVENTRRLICNAAGQSGERGDALFDFSVSAISTSASLACKSRIMCVPVNRELRVVNAAATFPPPAGHLKNGSNRVSQIADRTTYCQFQPARLAIEKLIERCRAFFIVFRRIIACPLV